MAITNTPQMAENISPDKEELYIRVGWQVLNKLLTRYNIGTVNAQNRVWIENFEEVRTVAQSIGKKELCVLFNHDTDNWKMDLDKDGTLYVVRNY